MSLPRTAVLLGFLLSALSASSALAQPTPTPNVAPSNAGKAEARDRFDRGLRLFNENDYAAALAEFKRVYELVPNALVLFNIGFVHAAMNHPVQAVEAFDQLLAAPGALSADRLAKARVTRDEQAQRISQIQVTVNVLGAAVEVDGLEVAKAPLAKPLLVAGGTHVVGAVAAGYAPSRKDVSAAGRATAVANLELAPMVGRLAHLIITTHLPGANVVVDGTSVGWTPLPASITLSPGSHLVELVRPGYHTARRNLELGDGASGEVYLEPEEDRLALDADGGTLALKISQKQALVTVDGRAKGVYVGSLRLAKGPHHLRVERGGFLTVEREVDVAPGGVTVVRVDLYPGADTLAAYTESARFHRTWGTIGVVAGAVIMGGSIAIFANDVSQRNGATAQLAKLESDLKSGHHPCGSTDPASQCNALINAEVTSYNEARNADTAGWIVGGLGLAAAGVGVALLMTGDELHRFDKSPEGDLLAGIHVTPGFWQTVQGGGFELRGTF